MTRSFVSFVVMYLDDRPCFQNIAMLMFTIVGLVAVIYTFLSSENLVIVYFVSITLHSDYYYVTSYLSNCYDITSSSLKKANMTYKHSQLYRLGLNTVT